MLTLLVIFLFSLTPGKYNQSDVFGENLPIFSSGRKGLYPAGNDFLAPKGMASSQINFLKVVEILIQRLMKLKYDSPDSRECLEQCGQMPSTYQATTTTAGKGSGTHHPALTASQSGRSHQTFLRSQAHESKSDPGRLPGDDTTAPR